MIYVSMFKNIREQANTLLQNSEHTFEKWFEIPLPVKQWEN